MILSLLLMKIYLLIYNSALAVFLLLVLSLKILDLEFLSNRFLYSLIDFGLKTLLLSKLSKVFLEITIV